ncbi:hypothetical protein FKM82_027017, partial [Ascaphus truei]
TDRETFHQTRTLIGRLSTRRAHLLPTLYFCATSSKQQSLEQRQADVEYELRCLLNKPEKDWLEEDKEREQVLMQELVTLIEQRNTIVKCLDEDRQREEEEDKMLEAMIQKKGNVEMSTQWGV